MIDHLMDQQNTFEIVRDKIALILSTEIFNQQVLAKAARKNPEDYKARVFTEVTSPLQEFLNGDGTYKSVPDMSPLINVSWDNSTFDKRKGSTVSRQASDTIYNIDVYGYGLAKACRDGGSVTGDTMANLALQKGVRIARKILMSSEYTSLGMTGVVIDRWITSMTAFQPLIDSRPATNIVGARISFNVNFNEYSPQATPIELTGVDVHIKRAENGEILVEASYDF